MRKGLFRQQALRYQRSPIEGTLLMTPKPAYVWFTFFLIFWLLAIGVFLSTSSYARKTTVSGWLSPSEGVEKIYAEPRKGRVSAVFVEEGQQVQQGNALLSIDYGVQHTQGKSIEGKQQEELDKKLSRLSESLRLRTQQFSRENAQLVQALEHANTDKRALSSLSDLAYQGYQLASHQLEAQTALIASASISRAEYQQAKLAVIQAKQQWQQAIREVKLKQADIHRLEYQLAELPQAYSRDIVVIENQISDLNSQRLTLTKAASHTLYASRDGVVSALQAYPGLNIQQGYPLLSITPLYAQIEATLLVPVSAAGFIEEGQALAIRYDAFPHQKFGIQEGSILSVSQALVLPGEWSHAPVPMKEPAYLVKAAIARSTIEAYGRSVPLRTGMTFSADVSLSQRSLLEWLLEPVYSITGRL